jgi:signal peptidase
MIRIKTTMKVTLYAFAIALVLFAVAHMSIKKEDQIAHILGFGFLSLESDDSQTNQAFESSDLLLVSMFTTDEQSSLVAGDIIIYYDKSIKDFQTKEIIEVQHESNQIITMSTDNLNTLKTIDTNEVIALYNYKVAYVGTALTYIQSASGFALFIILPILIICGYQSIKLFKSLLIIQKEKIEGNYNQDIKVAHQLFLKEKQKIKDAMFRDYMKHQRK